jgi:hypothetical protein
MPHISHHLHGPPIGWLQYNMLLAVGQLFYYMELESAEAHYGKIEFVNEIALAS